MGIILACFADWVRWRWKQRLDINTFWVEHQCTLLNQKVHLKSVVGGKMTGYNRLIGLCGPNVCIKRSKLVSK